MILTAIIVDDDEHGRMNLLHLINTYCPSIKVVDLADSVPKARTIIQEYSPNIVFLDINIPGENGFELLSEEKVQNNNSFIVFVTAHSDYAIKAIKFGATDYILKPIDVDELIACEQKIISLWEKMPGKKNPDPGSEFISAEKDKISLTHAKGIKIVNVEDIIFLEADSCYTILNLRNEKGYEKFIVSRTLSYFEGILRSDMFARCHKSYIANLREVKELINTNNGYLLMSNGSELEISRRKSSFIRQTLMEHYNLDSMK
jgi:two-component system LytT family response regulator